VAYTALSISSHGKNVLAVINVVFKVVFMSFCRSLLVYCRANQTCHHYDSMNQGNIEAAKRVWNFLRISTKGDFYISAL